MVSCAIFCKGVLRCASFLSKFEQSLLNEYQSLSNKVMEGAWSELRSEDACFTQAHLMNWTKVIQRKERTILTLDNKCEYTTLFPNGKLRTQMHLFVIHYWYGTRMQHLPVEVEEVEYKISLKAKGGPHLRVDFGEEGGNDI